MFAFISNNDSSRRFRPIRTQVTGKPSPTSDSYVGDNIFRKASCPCGGGCPACQAKSAGLNISQPNDPAEIEADQIADKVMRMADGDARPQSNSANSQNAIHRKCDACEEEEEGETIQRKEANISAVPTPPAPPNEGSNSRSGIAQIDSVISSGGRPLDLETRRFFEPRFGYDLSSVRIHTDSSAGQSARDIDARAYTLRNHIIFGSGQYQPESESGRHLLAHELAHTVQGQNGNGLYRQSTIYRDAVTPDTGARQKCEKMTKHEFYGLVNNAKPASPALPPRQYHVLVETEPGSGKLTRKPVGGELPEGKEVDIRLIDKSGAKGTFLGVCDRIEDELPTTQILYIPAQYVDAKEPAPGPAVSSQESAAEPLPADNDLLRQEIEDIRLRLGLGSERDSSAPDDFVPADSEQDILYKRLLQLEAEERRQLEAGLTTPAETNDADFSTGQSIPGPADDVLKGVGAADPASMTGTELENEIDDLRFALDFELLNPDNPQFVDQYLEFDGERQEIYLRLLLVEEEYAYRHGLSDEVRETTEKIAESQRKSGPSTQDWIELGASLANPASWGMAAFKGASMALGNPVEDFGTGFIPAFLAGAVIELPRDAFTKLKAELDEHPIRFNAGVMVGLPVGALWGLWDMLAGIWELGKLAAEFSPLGMTYSSIKDTYRLIFDSTKFTEEKKQEAAKRQAIVEALYEVVSEMLMDPAFMIGHGRELGEMAGRSAGKWFNKDFMPLSPEEKGFAVGKLEGRIVFEILALFLGPEEWLVRGMAAAGEAARFGSLFRKIVSKLPKVEKLMLELRAGAKAEGTIRKAAAEVGETGKVADEAVDLAEGAAHLADDAGSLGKVTPETTEFFKNKPEVKKAWIENPVAANALKFCESPCWPENITDPRQIEALDKFIRRAKEGNQVIDRRALHEALEKLPESEIDDYIRKLNEGLDARIPRSKTEEIGQDLAESGTTSREAAQRDQMAQADDVREQMNPRISESTTKAERGEGALRGERESAERRGRLEDEPHETVPEERPSDELFDDPDAPPARMGEALERPSLRDTTIEAIESAAPRNSKGQFVDPAGNVIQHPVYGHIYGHENRRIIAAGEELGLTQTQLNDYVNARPEFFQIEEEAVNLSHMGEMPGLEPYDHIVDDMVDFFGL